MAQCVFFKKGLDVEEALELLRLLNIEPWYRGFQNMVIQEADQDLCKYPWM